MRLPIVPLIGSPCGDWIFARASRLRRLRPRNRNPQKRQTDRNCSDAEHSANLASQYQKFLPMFRDVLKENTKDQTDEKSLILNIAAGVKEVGAAKPSGRRRA